MEFDEIMNSLNELVLLVLQISTLIGILDFVGFLPSKLRKWLRINRADDTIQVVEDMGVDVKRYKRKLLKLKYPQQYDTQEVQTVVNESLQKYKINKRMSVGHYRPTKLPYYYDLIGGTCDAKTAEYFAKILSAYWVQNAESVSGIKDTEFNFVVTPKGGSPILGYEFAKRMNSPFVLHEESPRFTDHEEDMRYWFDCSTVPAKGAKALIVDDSTTGGTMVSNAIEHLKKYGYNVSTCLVVFEPQSKNARERLEKLDVQLVSIVKTHT